MVPNQSWEANNRGATQELSPYFTEIEVPFSRSKEPATGPRPKSGNSKIYHPILYSRIHFNLILPQTSRSSKWFLSFWLPHEKPLWVPLFSYVCYISCPTYPPSLDHSNYFVFF
jgi:hypothetical protein